MQRLLSLLLFLLFVAPFAQATTTKASDFGYDPSNATAAFRAAIESDFDTIIVDLQAEDWWLEPTVFFGLEDKSIFFERDVVLRALPGAFDDQNANLIRLVGGKNIVLEGYSVSFQMNKAEYDTIAWSEWRHCLALWDCENVSIEGLTFKDSGGDGIFIGGSHEFGVGYCKDIRIKNVLCDNNYRQGMSVISVENLLVQHSRFDRT
ncbi:MAG: right-handed parallel beta-helix repeat-containing protein, partial [Bacteroidota bacterium]